MLLAWPLALVAARGTRGWTRSERVFFALTAGAIGLALAGPRVGDEPAPRRVWVAVDRSASAADRPGGRDWTSQAQTILGTLDPDDEAGVLLFGANASVAAGPEAPAALAQRLASLAVEIDPDASDLGGCLALADRLDGGTGELVLVADGRDTPGATDYAPPAGRRISAVAPRDAPDWRIARVDAPARLAPGEPCRMHVAVEASAAGRARLVLSRAGRRVREAELTFAAPGRSTVILVDAPDDPGGLGRIDYRLELEAQHPDPWPGNDAHGVVVELALQPRLVWITTDPEGEWTSHWTRALAGVARLEPIAPEGAARRLDAGGLDGVAIADVPAAALGAAQEPIARYVERGGGLVFLGGRASLAGGGYLEGRVEAVLPVFLGPRPDDEPPGVAILVDSSGSMGLPKGATKLELARAGAIEIVRHVERGTRVGVWTFADTPVEVEPFVVIEDEATRAALVARLRVASWTAHGGTSIAEALSEATRKLQAAHPRGPRHAILVSDGASGDVVDREGELDALLGTSGRAVVLTVVRVGEEVAGAEEALARLAGRSGGRLVPVRAPDELPHTMLDGYRRARRGLLADPGRRAAPGPAFERAGGLALPQRPLGEVGRTPARGKDEAVLVVARADGADGIPLAAWREHEGGGRAAYVQLGASGDPRWGGSEEDHPRIDAVVAACAQWALDRVPAGLAWQIELDAGVLRAWVRVGEADAVPGRDQDAFLVRTARGVTVALEPSGRGLWHGTLALASGVHELELVRAGPDGAARPTGLFRTVAVPYARELGNTAADVARLRGLVQATGGQWLDGAEPYRPSPRPRRPGRPFGAELLVLAAGLVVGRALRVAWGS